MVTIFLQEGKHLKCQGLSSKTDDTKFFWLVQTSSKHKREMKHFGKASAFWFRVGGTSSPGAQSHGDVKAQLGAVKLFVSSWLHCESAQRAEMVPSVRDCCGGVPKMYWQVCQYFTQCNVPRKLMQTLVWFYFGTCLISLLLPLLLQKGDVKQWNNWEFRSEWTSLNDFAGMCDRCSTI